MQKYIDKMYIINSNINTKAYTTETKVHHILLQRFNLINGVQV